MESSNEIWIISGESSGDLYGAKIAQELKLKDPSLKIKGMGGLKMRRVGVEIMVDSTELGVIGIVEVLENIFKFIKIFLFLVKEAKRVRPRGVVMVDYPGFNLRFAKALWKLGIPVVWYISPQVWVWRKGNIKKLAKYCKKMLVIFPFEPEVYEGSGLDAEFVGHPLVEIVQERTDPSIERDPDTVLLLPGSRKKEIKYLLEPFLETVSILKMRRPELSFVISAPRETILNMIREGIAEFHKKHPGKILPEIELSSGKTSFWQQRCTCGLAASGTVTVECAIAGLPLVVAYKLNNITFMLARLIIGKLFRGFFTMVNIILYKNVFHEFLQHFIVPETLADEVEMLLPGGSRREEVDQDMKAMTDALRGGSEGAMKKTAKAILEACK